MSRTVDELLSEALLHFDAAADYAHASDGDERMIVDAMSMRLFAGLEALTRLADGEAERLFSGQWPDMRGLRHRIAHGYGAISLTRVRETVTGDLPAAIATIRRELDRSARNSLEPSDDSDPRLP